MSTNLARKKNIPLRSSMELITEKPRDIIPSTIFVNSKRFEAIAEHIKYEMHYAYTMKLFGKNSN